MDEHSGQTGFVHGVLGFILTLGSLLFGMAVVVGLHRTILLDETRQGLRFPRFDGNLKRYFVLCFGTGILGLIAGVIIAEIVTVIAHASGHWIVPAGTRPHLHLEATWFGFVVCLLIFARFMLALPSAAVGGSGSVGTSYKATQGNWLRLVAVATLTGLPLVPLVIASASLEAGALREAISTGRPAQLDHSTLFLIVSTAIRTLEAAVMTVMLSLSYRHLVQGGMSPVDQIGTAAS
jgi:hypothetical protein